MKKQRVSAFALLCLLMICVSPRSALADLNNGSFRIYNRVVMPIVLWKPAIYSYYYDSGLMWHIEYKFRSPSFARKRMHILTEYSLTGPYSYSALAPGLNTGLQIHSENRILWQIIAAGTYNTDKAIGGAPALHIYPIYYDDPEEVEFKLGYERRDTRNHLYGFVSVCFHHF